MPRILDDINDQGVVKRNPNWSNMDDLKEFIHCGKYFSHRIEDPFGSTLFFGQTSPFGQKGDRRVLFALRHETKAAMAAFNHDDVVRLIHALGEIMDVRITFEGEN